MNFEPQKFFVGLVDFFSVLMPGIVLAYLLKDRAGPWILGSGYAGLHGTEAWAILLFTSYLLGHFLFLIGSLLDDRLYEPVRKSTDKEQITRVLSGRRLSPQLIRWVAKVCFKKQADAAVDQVIRMKEAYLKRIGAPDAVNAFQWCKSRLALEHPEALAPINRFEADSKFFRSFVPVLVALMGLDLFRGHFGLAAAVLGLLALALWRYLEQRFKSTQQAYWMVLTLESEKQSGQSGAEQSKALSSKDVLSQPTHAGGVVFKNRLGEAMYLLVEASADSHEWVLPKGHVEPFEDTRRTAIREVREETGVWARIVSDLEMVEYAVGEEVVKARFYLMEELDEGWPEDPLRQRVWLSLADALDRASHRESKSLLVIADKLRTRHEADLSRAAGSSE